MTLRGLYADRTVRTWAFIGAFIVCCGVYEYGRILNLRPQPHHLMRQCDCLGPTYNYFIGDANLFRPWMCNLHADGDTSGESAGEFPLIYWSMGMLWRVIGQSEFAYRLFGVLLHLFGSLALFRMATRILRSTFWAGWITLIFFTSPTIVYFAISFLPDVPALDLVLIGWWSIQRYVDERSAKWLWSGAFLMGLGAMLKVTAGMSVLALFAVLLTEGLLPRKRLPVWRVFPRRMLAWAALMGAALMVFAWYAYAAHYNAAHNAPYTPNSIWPVWEMTGSEIDRAVRFASTVLVHELLPIPVWGLLLFFLVVLIRHTRRLPIQLVVLNGALLVGLVLFVIGWFQALNNHDYYFINPLIVPIALSVSMLWYFVHHHGAWMNSALTRVLAMAVLVYCVLYAAIDIDLRTHNGDHVRSENALFSKAQLQHWEDNQYWEMRPILGVTPTLRGLGIRPEDRVIVLTDHSWQNALYLMGHRGWNDFTMYFNDSAAFEHCLRNNASYLIINDPVWSERPYVQPYLAHPIGRYEEVRIFDLRPLLARAKQ
ncbi:MAG: glycosyltransferase family 39 protein [Flavobacteriales bacterium]|nr:glycosyltransferase family 39 protein [Flavobacteriales bacterium]